MLEDERDGVTITTAEPYPFLQAGNWITIATGRERWWKRLWRWVTRNPKIDGSYLVTKVDGNEITIQVDSTGRVT
jgi:hypothetical protein